MWTSDCIAFFMLVVSCQGQGGILNNSVLWVASDGYLYFSTRLQEWTEAKITPQEFGQSIISVVIKDASSIHGIAGDIPTRHLVTSDTDNNWIILFDLDANGITYFHIGTSKDIGHLAIDWLGRNVYWTDAGFGWIAMKHLPENINQINSADQNFRVVVDEFIEKPTGIVVHPERYFLFWTDTGQTPKIERSNLIGQERKTIIWQSIVTPTTLCIDQSAERLYWSDPARRTIEYSDFDGNGRRILVSDQELNYYGIAVFRDSLIYTVPNFNRTGYVSLKENNEGEHIQASIETENTKLFDVMAYASEIQEEPTDAFCKKVNECDQICLHMEKVAGFTCLCSDGYDLTSGRDCTVDEKVLERHILFTNDKSICAVPISVLSLGSSDLFSIHCDLVKRDSYITRFAVNMRTKMVFHTNESTIFKQPAFKENQREVLYESAGIIIDMDFDWISGLLYWMEDNGHLYNVHEYGLKVFDEKLTDSDITNIAVDPYNRKVYWISSVLDGMGKKYVLNAWSMKTKTTEIIPTSLLSNPSDLEYDRLKDRLLWNDNDGYIGMINTDGTGERKYDTATTGEPRHAVTVYKNFIISSTEENRQFDIVYELDEQRFRVNIHKAYVGFVEDVHVYESALQSPLNLESCEINNGDCEHECLPGSERKCACFLGYFLNDDNKSCRQAVLNENYFVILDAVHERLYQVDLETKAIHVIEIRQDNVPVGIAFDPKRNGIIWVDKNTNVVKKITLGSSYETAVMSGVENNAAIAVDVSTGNIYISSGREISVVSLSLNSLTIVDSTNIIANIGKIAIMPQSGLIAWYEGNTQIVIANMDGSNVRPITVQSIEKPEDIAFDLDDDRGLYWCDSILDKIEKIDTQTLAISIVYEGRGLRPVAIEIFADVIYLVPMQQRKIVQINKINGLQQRDVFESPLFGSLDNFFISKKSVTVAFPVEIVEEDGKQSYVIYIAIGVGGVEFLVIVGVAAVFLCRRRNKRKPNGTVYDNVQGNPHTYETHGHNGGYATADDILSPDPPPSQERIPEPEEYDYLDEANMISAAKFNVFLPPQGDDSKNQEDRRASSACGRYSKGPIENYGYLTAIYTGSVSNEPPEYLDFNDYNQNDDYLQPSSIDSGSGFGSINRSFAHESSYHSRDQHNSGTYQYRNSGNGSDGRVSFIRDSSYASQNVKYHA